MIHGLKLSVYRFFYNQLSGLEVKKYKYLTKRRVHNIIGIGISKSALIPLSFSSITIYILYTSTTTFF